VDTCTIHFTRKFIVPNCVQEIGHCISVCLVLIQMRFNVFMFRTTKSRQTPHAVANYVHCYITWAPSLPDYTVRIYRRA
jgi:hypothetical protein